MSDLNFNNSFNYLYKNFPKNLKINYFYYKDKIQIPSNIKDILKRHVLKGGVFTSEQYLSFYYIVGVFDIHTKILTIFSTEKINESKSFLKLFQYLNTLIIIKDEKYEILHNRFGDETKYPQIIYN